MKSKVIFHIDLNAFFATAEIIKNPKLAGLPLVVGGNSRRSVVSTATYEARAFGIHSGMPVAHAQKLCKNLIVLEGNFPLYRSLSEKFINYLKTYTSLIEQASIDECYVDMTDVIEHYEKPLDLAVQIQKDLFELYELKCSIGVSYNRFLAKMASDMRKPMGITVLRKAEIPVKLWPLSIADMYGIGKKTAPALIRAKIKTIGDLAKETNVEAARVILGKNYINYYNRANGMSDDKIFVYNEDDLAKSISHSTTLIDDIVEYDEVKEVLGQLANQVFKKLNKQNMSFNQISITIKYHDFKSIVRSRKLSERQNALAVLYEEIMSLYDENESDVPIRLLGISVGGLKHKSNSIKQFSLFDTSETSNEVNELLNTINKKYQSKKVIIAKDIINKK